MVEAGPLVSEMLRGAAGVKVVVTSREALRISGEKVLAVPPLGLPSLRPLPPPAQLVHYEAVRLFIDRAVSVKSDFEVTNENAPAVAEICHRLDGLPLAIELAASRIRLFAPETLLLRLDRGLGTTLTGGARDLSAWQQTLKGAIAWSVELLTPGERTLFARLSVFMGGFTMEAAEAVGSDPGDPGMVGDLDILTGIEGLADKSLVRLDGGTVTEPRFRMLETIRDHAVGMAREAGIEAALRDRHLEWITDLFTSTQEASRRVGGQVILDRLYAELGNLRQALAWASEVPVDGKRVTLGLRTCVASVNYWRLRHDLIEGSVALERLLGLVDPLMPGGSGTAKTQAVIPADVLSFARTNVIVFRGTFFGDGVQDWISPMLKEAIAHFQTTGDRRGEGRALLALSWYFFQEGLDSPEAQKVALDAITASSEASDDQTWSLALGRAAVADWMHQRGDHSLDRIASAHRLASESGDVLASAETSRLLGHLQLCHRRWEEASTHFSRNVGIGGVHEGWAVYFLTVVALHTGNVESARAHLVTLEGGIASGRIPPSFSSIHLQGAGQLAMVKARTDEASGYFRQMLVGTPDDLEALGYLAVIEAKDGNTGTTRELIGRALAVNPAGNRDPVPEFIAVTASLVIQSDPERGVRLGAIACLMLDRRRYPPMYAQDEAWLMAILDRARVAHGIPMPEVPSDLTAAGAISECLQALALLP